MRDPLEMELARERREGFLREAQERRLARTLRGLRPESANERQDGSEVIRVRWGLAEEEPAVADLLQLNGMPRWVAFEERFIVAEKDGRLLGALRYRTESKRLLLGLLVVDPWAGEERLARALYAGAGELARELGVGEAIASACRVGYPGEVGYYRWGRSWRLDVTRSPDATDRVSAGGWRRVLAMFGEIAVPFHRPFHRFR